MTKSTAAIARVFSFNSLQLTDLDPSLPPEQVIRMYAANYPTLATAKVGDPTFDGVRHIYPVEPLDFGDKG